MSRIIGNTDYYFCTILLILASAGILLENFFLFGVAFMMSLVLQMGNDEMLHKRLELVEDSLENSGDESDE